MKSSPLPSSSTLSQNFAKPLIQRALALGIAALMSTGTSGFAAGDPCVVPGVSVATDPAGDATPAGASPQQDITEVFIAEPGQSDGVPKLVTTVKVAALTPATLPPNGNWRVYFKVGAVTYFTTVFNDPNTGVRYEYGNIDPVTGSNSTIGGADGGSISAADKTLSVVIAMSKVGSPAPGSSLANIYGRTQTLVGAAGTGALATHDTAPNAGATSTATYTLLTASAACAAPGGTPTPTPPPAAAGPDTPRYHNFAAPQGMGNGAGEPTLGAGKPNLAGQPPSAGGPTMYIAGLETLRVSWDDCASPAGALWENKTAPTTPPTTLDPILYTDFGAGRTSPSRTFVSQLGPKTSFLTYSDNNGQTYSQSQGSGINSGVDHQTIGGGPYRANATPPAPPNIAYPNAIYYASQDIAVAQLARSDDGGQTFGAAVPMYNLSQCGGLHGHVKVAPDGTVYVPNKNCGGKQAVVVSENNGVTFSIRPIPASSSRASGNDPSVGIDADGKLYFAFQDGDGRPKVAVSSDRGLTWSQPTDIGAAFGLKNSVFPAAVGGSSGRGAVQFLATDEPGNYQATGVFKGVWHIYASHTFDGGATWATTRVTPENDPVQRGSICTGGTTCGGDRNLLDFNDMEIDHEGRLLIAYADGCIGCTSPVGTDSRAEKATIARQSGGKRLLAQFDPLRTDLPGAPAISGGLNADSTAVTLTWSAPDNGGSEITGYNVYRREGEAGTFTLLATVTEPTYTDTTFNNTVSNFYRVTAVNSTGEGPFCRDFQPQVVIPPNPCALPGVLVVNDVNANRSDNDGGVNTPPDPRVNVRQVSVAEPFFGTGAQKLVFTMQLAPSATASAPPSSQWYLIWQRLNPDANFDRYYVAMKSDTAGNVSYEYGKFGVPLSAGTEANPNANTPVKLGNADSGTYDPVNGVITITLSNSKAENITAGQTLAKLNARTYLSRPEPGPKAQNNASDITADFDYTLFGNDFCRVNTAPIAALTASPRIGDAPLTVTFDCTASSDPDAGDSIASYSYDAGDGAQVTQSSPTIQHTYEEPGIYRATVRVTDSNGKVSENAAAVVIEVAPPNTAVNAKFYNIATRVVVEQGDNVGIGGFIIRGNQPKRVIVRGVGPSLQKDGSAFPGKLEDPTIDLFDGNQLLIDSNNDWRSSNEAEIRATNLAPSNDREAAIVRQLAPGAYTVVLTGNADSTGVGLVEVYDLEGPTEAQLANLSTRGRVETGDRLLIGGLIVRGGNPQQVVVRAIGPSMSAKGVPDTLQNPQLELRDGDGNLILANDNWGDTQREEIQGTGLAPEDPREAAVVRNLGAGVYTTIVFGKDGTGNALVEAYNVGNP